MATPMALVGLLEEQDMNSGEVLALRLEDVDPPSTQEGVSEGR